MNIVSRIFKNPYFSAFFLLLILEILFSFNLFLGLLTVKAGAKELSMRRILATLNKDYLAQYGQQLLGTEGNTQDSDARTKILNEFLVKYHSPLSPYSEKIVTVSDKYGLYYGLIPAIAMVESNLCLKAPALSYNCWGWGIYGKKVTRFSSYDEAIETVARGLKKYYLDEGLTSPEQIVVKYNPTNHNNWLGSVKYFLDYFD